MKSDAWYQKTYGWYESGSGIKSSERVRKFGEVLTPRWMAEKMVDCVPGAAEIDATVFEPCCGEGAFITVVLRKKLERTRTADDMLIACKACYGVDIQYDNVVECRRKLVEIAQKFGVDRWDAEFIFARNIIHGDMLFFPMIARFYDWQADKWVTLEEMANGKGS